jgi:anti-sigma factor RsiW
VTENAESERHPEPALLLAYRDGKCSPPERASVEHHLELCPRCRTELASLEGFDFGAIGAPESSGAPILHPGHRSDRGWQRWLWAAVGVAVGLMGLVMLCARGLGG